jgi:hypothetical protein
MRVLTTIQAWWNNTRELPLLIRALCQGGMVAGPMMFTFLALPIVEWTIDGRRMSYRELWVTGPALYFRYLRCWLLWELGAWPPVAPGAAGGSSPCRLPPIWCPWYFRNLRYLRRMTRCLASLVVCSPRQLFMDACFICLAFVATSLMPRVTRDTQGAYQRVVDNALSSLRCGCGAAKRGR